MNNPLGRSTQKPEQSNTSQVKNNRAKEFESKLLEEERSILLKSISVDTITLTLIITN